MTNIENLTIVFSYQNVLLYQFILLTENSVFILFRLQKLIISVFLNRVLNLLSLY